MKKEELVRVYTALLEVDSQQMKRDLAEISERANMEKQRTEIILDELEHMGLVEVHEEQWYPKIRFERDS